MAGVPKTTWNFFVLGASNGPDRAVCSDEWDRSEDRVWWIRNENSGGGASAGAILPVGIARTELPNVAEPAVCARYRRLRSGLLIDFRPGAAELVRLFTHADAQRVVFANVEFGGVVADILRDLH